MRAAMRHLALTGPRASTYSSLGAYCKVEGSSDRSVPAIIVVSVAIVGTGSRAA